MKRRVDGFILVMTLMIISATVLLVSLAVNRVRAYRTAHVLWVDRERARVLAQSGIDIAMAQLAVLNKKPEKDEEKRDMATLVYKKCNAWQTFTLQEAADGVDGELQLYIGCEEGKINLNHIYDREKKMIAVPGVADTKEFLETINKELKALAGKSEFSLEKALDQLFEKRKVIDDVSELLSATGGESFADKLFVQPSEKSALTDLFTTSTDHAQIIPFMLSATVQQMLGLHADADKVKPAELIKLMQEPSISWKTEWNRVLAPVYGKEFTTLPSSITALFATHDGATTFSVVSYGKVGNVTQKLCAIISKNQNAKSDQPYIIKKLYWL